jgi:hypothetical protein
MDDEEKLRIVDGDDPVSVDDLETFLVDGDSFVNGLRTEATEIPGGFDDRYDGFGVPNNMLGKVPENFYGLLGRVVSITALMEAKLDDLVGTLTDKVQSKFAGQDTGRALSMARRMFIFPLAERPSTPYRVAKEALDLLDRVEALAHERNSVVHSVWPGVSLDDVRGWRHTPKKQRPDEVTWTTWYETDEIDLVTFINRLATATEELIVIRQRLDGFPRLAWMPR